MTQLGQGDILKLSPQQRRAGFYEFVVGVPANILLAGALYYFILPAYPNLNTPTARLIFTIQCNALPGMNMLIALLTVAFGRGTSKALDPLAGAESRTLQIHLRFLTNTLEQLVLFFVASLALSTFLDAQSIRIIPVAAILFFVNRFVFWFGYLKDPTLRGAGLSGTLYPILFMMAAAFYHAAEMLMRGW